MRSNVIRMSPDSEPAPCRDPASAAGASGLGGLVSARITPLRLEAFEQLPKHARRCVFWEVDPATLQRGDHLADPEFERKPGSRW
ncbi:hypothetical protein MMAD_00190 [Mycolicibacterium madagascariense]|uniref:Uncharacterized protein n=1 Tax=Mycolicibacterium madagascariense TaxID=212765 RepID=A0A7I7X867_9MYCO|nr:hypothetical protein MMAD_00190 [Mycolicibacterium madagascariense]